MINALLQVRKSAELIVTMFSQGTPIAHPNIVKAVKRHTALLGKLDITRHSKLEILK